MSWQAARFDPAVDGVLRHTQVLRDVRETHAYLLLTQLQLWLERGHASRLAEPIFDDKNRLEAERPDVGKYEYQSEFARKYVAQGRKEGLKEGLEKGLYQGEQAALLEVIDARGLTVDESVRQRITACTELSQLKVWLRRAVTARSIPEILEPSPVVGPSAR